MTKPLCTFPWAHLDIETNGDIKYCCASVYQEGLSHTDESGNHYNVNTHSIDEAWNSARIIKLRENLYNGIKAPECKVCWDQESRGEWSVRKAADMAKDDDYPNIQETIDRSAANGFVVDDFPKYYQIQTGNMCNLACKMCHSDYSTTYGDFYKELYPDNVNQNKYNFLDNDNKGNTHRSAEPARYTWPKDIGLKALLDDEKTPHVKRLFLSGGEPTIILENLDFLEHLVETGKSKKIHLIVITNSTKINPRFAEVIKHFSRTTLTLSIDAIGGPIEIQRYPADWERIDKNIIQYAELAKNNSGVQIAFNTVVSCLTLPTLDELLFYIAKQRKKYNITFASLFSLEHGDLSLNIVPVTVLNKSKQRIRRALEINRKLFDQRIIETVENFLTSLDHQIERNNDDYTDVSFALNKIQEHHPDRDIKSIFPVYFPKNL
jgi:hypothetical protein